MQPENGPSGILPNTKDRKSGMRNNRKDIFDLFKGVEFEKNQKSWNWALSGHAVRPRKTCGDVHPIGCDHTLEHHNKLGKASLQVIGCKRLGCPICYETAAGNRSLTILSRFSKKHFGESETQQIFNDVANNHKEESTQKTKKQIIHYLEKAISRQKLKVKHVVISPVQNPDAWKTHKDYTKSRKTAYKMLKRCGVDGGVLIPHPYRLKCADCGHSPIPDHRTECPTCHSDRFLWYFAPHFHVIGYGWIKDTTKNYQATGWILKNLGIRKSIYSTSQYLLSHAGVNKGTLTINWFGSLSRQQLGKNIILPKMKQHCCECHTPFTMLVYNLHTDRPPPKLVYNKTGENDFTFKTGEYVHKTKI